MLQRDAALARVRQMAESGACVIVTGDALSGRTHLLKRLNAELITDGWRCLHIRGTAALRNVPFGALTVSGVKAPSQGGVMAATLAAYVDVFSEQAKQRNAVVIVDDWDELDEMSRGVVAMARREWGLPVVITAERDGNPHTATAGISTAFNDTWFTVLLEPLRFEDLNSLASARLGGPMDPATASRVFSQSGGNIGLAFALLDAAVHESKLVLTAGSWRAAADLWTPALNGVVEQRLSRLNPAERDAVELLSIADQGTVDTARRIVNEATLERLEDLGIVRLYPAADGNLLSVNPPLLVDYFRHAPLGTRKMRLSAEVQAALGPVHSPELRTRMEAGLTETDALFTRMTHESLRARRLTAQADWESDPTTETGTAYVAALVAEHAPEPEIDTVLFSALEMFGDDEARAQLVVFAASQRAFAKNNLDEALAQLQAAEPEAGDYAGYLRAFGVLLESVIRAVPADAEQRLDITGEAPAGVLAARQWAAAQIATIEARFDDSDRHLAQLSTLDRSEFRHESSALAALNLLGRGHVSVALARAIRGFEECKAALDPDGLRAFGHVAALCLFIRGEYASVDTITATVFGLGDPLGFPRLSYYALSCIAATVASRRGKQQLAEEYLRQIEGLADGPLPGMVKGLPQVQYLVAAGRHDEAADLAQQCADEQWDRGWRYQAYFSYILALESSPTLMRCQAVHDRLQSAESELFAAQFAHLRAVADKDVPALLDAADRLESAGLPGHVLGALSVARSLLDAGEKGSETQARIERLTEISRTGSYDNKHFHTDQLRLTSREQEVAELVLSGMSNRAIADMLVISIRTAESHIHHITNKTGAVSRADLAERLRSYINQPGQAKTAKRQAMPRKPRAVVSPAL